MPRSKTWPNFVLSSRKTMILVTTLFALNVNSAKGNYHELASNIRPNTNEQTQQQAALNVIRRLIGDKSDNVSIKINFSFPGNYFKVRISIFELLVYELASAGVRKPMNKF